MQSGQDHITQNHMTLNHASRPKRCLLVLGMHRSGTSALTGTLSKLGVDLGENLLKPQWDNPAGFFEHNGIVELNDRLLWDMNSSWEDPDFPAAPPHRLELEFRRAISRIVQDDFSESQVWAIKDPRVCRFPQIYGDVITSLGFAVTPIVALRLPSEVCGSLERRSRMSPDLASWLWLRHTLNALMFAGCRLRNLVFYDRLMRETGDTLAALMDLAGLSESEISKEKLSSIEGFLVADYRHYNGMEKSASTDADTVASMADRFFWSLFEAKTDQDVENAVASARSWMATRSDAAAVKDYLEYKSWELEEEAKNRYAPKLQSDPMKYFLLRMEIKLLNSLKTPGLDLKLRRMKCTRLRHKIDKLHLLDNEVTPLDRALSRLQTRLFGFPA